MLFDVSTVRARTAEKIPEGNIYSVVDTSCSLTLHYACYISISVSDRQLLHLKVDNSLLHHL